MTQPIKDLLKHTPNFKSENTPLSFLPGLGFFSSNIIAPYEALPKQAAVILTIRRPFYLVWWIIKQESKEVNKSDSTKHLGHGC